RSACRLDALLRKAREAVVRQRLPGSGVGDEGPVRGPDAGIAVDRAEPDADHLGILGIAAPERAAAGRAEHLHEAVRRAVVLHELLACRMRSEPGTTRADAEAAVPVRRWQRVQWQ